jgi:hypothetical protein
MGVPLRSKVFETGAPAKLDIFLLRRRLADTRRDEGRVVPRTAPVRESDADRRPEPPKSTRARPASNRPIQRIAKIALCAGAAVALAPPIVGYARLNSVKAEYQSLNARSTAVVVRDREGRFIGVQPQPGAPGPRLHLPSEDVPDPFYRMLAFLEDRPSSSPLRNWYGINFLSIGRNGTCVALRFIVDDERRCGGASTLPMQASRGTRGMFGGQSENWVQRKFREFADAPSISLMFEEGSVEHRRFIVDSLSYGSVRGFELWGPRLAARVIFGREPSDLSLAEQALLAALPKYRIPLRCEPLSAEQEERDEAARESIRDRAISALRGALPTEDARVRHAIAELRSLRLPRAPSPLPAELTHGLTSAEACEAAANPSRAVALIASSELILARDEMRRLAQDRRSPITEIMLTVDVAEQRRFKREAALLLRSLSVQRRRHLNRPLIGNEHAADVLLVGTGPDGAIHLLYNLAARPLLDEGRRAASVAKLLIATAAAGARQTRLPSLCNRPVDARERPLSRFARRPCSPAETVSIEETFGRSLNFAAHDLASSVGEDQLGRAALDGGFYIPSQMSAAEALSFGMAEATPRTMLAFAQAFSRGAAGCDPVARQPHIVSRVRIADHWIAATPRNDISISRYATGSEATQFLRVAGGAALSHSRGTLAPLRRSAPQLRFEIAKSGTVAGARPNLDTMAKLGVGAVAGRYSWISLVAAPTGALGDRHLDLHEMSDLIRRRTLATSARANSDPSIVPERCGR